MADTTQKTVSLFDTSNDENQLGPLVVSVLVVLVVALMTIVASGHGNLP